MAATVNKVSMFAIYSRILVLFLQAFFNALMPDHDAGVFNPPNSHRQYPLDFIIDLLFGGLKRWDAIYMLHVAEHGYTYENTLAFFPIFPLSVRVIGNTVLFPLQFFMNYTNVLLLSAVLVNFVCFVYSAKVLYKLSDKVLQDEKLAYKAAQLYCINPASVFFSAPYSETMFAALGFSGMLCLENKRLTKAALYFGLSAVTRSNGLVNCGFIFYRQFIEGVKQLLDWWKANLRDRLARLAGFWTVLIFILLPCTIYTSICVIPFVINQYYAYTIFCNPAAHYKDLANHILNYGNNQLYKMPHTGLSKWCSWSLPVSYSYVQDTHWDVGFLKYYELKQIPNFILATPMVLLCLVTVVCYVIHRPWYSLSLGVYGRRDNMYKKTDDIDDVSDNHGFYGGAVFVYIVHMAFLVTVAVLFMHVQVTTRFIASSCPVIYWFISWVSTPTDQLQPKTHNKYDIFAQVKKEWKKADDMNINTEHMDKNSEMCTDPDNCDTNTESVDMKDRTESLDREKSLSTEMLDWENQNYVVKAIFIYFHLYFFVGIGAFSNFLPWT